jgi:hypothetical protein
MHPQSHQGVCADAIATMEGITRADLDALGPESQKRAAKATANGHFDKSLVAVYRDSTGNARGCGRFQAIGGILDCKTMVRGPPKPCQRIEINVGCRFLARNIVSSDDDRKQAAPVPTERDRQQFRDIAECHRGRDRQRLAAGKSSTRPNNGF